MTLCAITNATGTHPPGRILLDCSAADVASEPCSHALVSLVIWRRSGKYLSGGQSLKASRTCGQMCSALITASPPIQGEMVEIFQPAIALHAFHRSRTSSSSSKPIASESTATIIKTNMIFSLFLLFFFVCFCLLSCLFRLCFTSFLRFSSIANYDSISKSLIKESNLCRSITLFNSVLIGDKLTQQLDAILDLVWFIL